MSGRLVLDVTTSYHWNSRDVGITRTERMLARRLFERSDSRFVRFDRPSLEYVEVTRSEMIARASRQSPQVPATYAPIPDRAVRGRVIGAAKRAARAMERLVPEASRADYWASIRHARLAVVRVLPQPQVAGRDGTPSPAVLSNPFAFERSDVYMSVGLDWDSNSYPHLYDLKRRVGFRVVLTCYDLIPVLLPQFIGSDASFYGRHFVDLLHTADLVTCISETSMRDLRRFARSEGLPLPETVVVHLGADFHSDAPESVGADHHLRAIPTPFVLMVGTIEPRKNHRLAFDVWERMVDVRGVAQTPTLVVVGRRGWRVDDLLLQLSLNAKLRDVVVLRSDVSDAELSWLYANCRFTILPSMYEGWGLPVIESCSYGKLCVASSTPAVVEAGFGAMVHIDPFDAPTWLSTISRLMDDDQFLHEQELRVQAVRAELGTKLSWDRYVEHIVALADGLPPSHNAVPPGDGAS